MIIWKQLSTRSIWLWKECRATKYYNYKNDPKRWFRQKNSHHPWDYVDVMKELAKQSSNNRIKIQVGDQIYIFKKTYSQNPDELQFILAEKIYDSIRECDTNICTVAENLGFKSDNIKNVKIMYFRMSMILTGMVQMKLNINVLMPLTIFFVA